MRFCRRIDTIRASISVKVRHMKNDKRNIASAAATRMRWCDALLLCAAMVYAAGGAAHAGEPGWIEHVVPAGESSRVLALAANRERNAVAMLYAESDTGGAGEQLRLMAFDAGGKLFKSADLGPLLAGEKIVMHSKAGLAVDSGVAYVAVASTAGVVKFSALDLRRSAAGLSKSLQVGSGSVEVTAMLVSKTGALMLAGAVDGKGFVAEVSKQGAVAWTKYYDEVVVVLDLAETDNGLVAVGGMPGRQFFDGLWLARLGPAGAVLETQSRQGTSRFARLAGGPQRLGLVYEKLGPDLDTSTVLTESFGGAASLRETRAVTLYQGRLTAPFSVAQVDERMVAAGVVARARLQLLDVWPEARTEPLIVSAAKAPDFIRFHSVDIVGTAGAMYLAALRSRADGRRQQLELVFAKIPAR
jgi:hypothetical protein